MMLTALFLRSPTNLRAYGADDELSQHVLDPVLSLGHSNSPLLAHFCQAPKRKGLHCCLDNQREQSVDLFFAI